MPLFEYSALDARGRKRAGFVDAGTLSAARERLKADGFFVVSLEDAAAGKDDPSSRELSLFGRMSRKDLATTARQIATLLKAGLTLVQALEALMEQVEKPAVRKVLSSVRNGINEGKSFHEALAEHPSVFPPIYIQMVRAGESGGFLDAIMARLAVTLEKETRLRSKVLAALTYPIIMTLLGFTFLLFLFAYVVPQVVGIFSDFGRVLPLPTRILLFVSDLASRFWPALVAAGVLGFLLYRKLAASARFGPVVDGLKLKVPVFGRLALKIATVRMCFILGSLLQSGVPLLRSLEVAGQVIGNRVLNSAVGKAAMSVSRGGSLADALRAGAVFPPLVSRVIAVGEESGDLAGMLTSVAESYEEEVTTSIQALTSVMEPILILLMAGVVLFVVLAVLLPIFDLNQLVRSG
ncbi:MAG TPA: type II secretion system protein GspF [Proteobacteria bacterium]|nr:type II secretion system protein F [bacterium BMS3Abin14]HDL53517.1 type II secretion system protein GspF [Pseudomonadota bacterium]